MKDICILLIDEELKNQTNLIYINNRRYFLAKETLEKEIRDFGIDAGIEVYSDISLIPSTVNANLIVFLKTSTYIPEDFLNKSIALNNLFRDAGVFCGPIYNNSLDFEPSKFLKFYHKYELDFGSNEVSNITEEEFNYPNICGCVFTGRAFNEFRYRPTISNRHQDIDNILFLSEIAKKHKIYYAKCLDKVVSLTKKDFSIENLSDYYYRAGYRDGILLLNKTIKDKHKELWHRFVESPEMFDNEMPRWLFDSSAEESGDYIEHLVLLKCKYQIGFYEGMLGKKLI